MAGLIPHQFTMGSVFSQSMDILGKNFWKFCGAVLLAWAAFMVLLVPVVMVWIGLAAAVQDIGVAATAGDLRAVLPHLAAGGLLLVALVTVLAFPTASIAYGTVQQLRGQPFSFAQSMAFAFRYLIPTVIANCLWVVAYTVFNGGLIAAGVALWNDAAVGSSLAFVGLLFVCAILGGMVLYARFVVLIPAIIAEGLGAIAGLSRSFRLTEGYTLRIWFMTFLLWLAFSAIGLFAQFLPLIGSIAVNTVYVALNGTLSAVVYVELRRTKESFGIEEYAAVFD
jgi:hypothetical protein